MSDEAMTVRGDAADPEPERHRQLQRQLARALAKAAKAPRPMRSEGYVIFSGDGSTYLQHKTGARRRITRDADGNVYLVHKLTKAERKAQKRARRHA